MKKILKTAGLILLSVVFTYAQNKQSGIFLTQLDFENGKLSYSDDDPSNKNKIHFHEFLDRPFVTIKHNGEKLKFFKDEIFAYQKNGRVVRTCNFVPYTFVERGPIWVYRRDFTVSKGKGTKRERKYYFSVAGKETIIPLTTHNLKRSFPDKPLFHHLLDAQFRTDNELSLYDGLQNKLKVNYLLETTIFDDGITSP
jgi:hypothetical protein